MQKQQTKANFVPLEFDSKPIAEFEQNQEGRALFRKRAKTAFIVSILTLISLAAVVLLTFIFFATTSSENLIFAVAVTVDKAVLNYLEIFVSFFFYLITMIGAIVFLVLYIVFIFKTFGTCSKINSIDDNAYVYGDYYIVDKARKQSWLTLLFGVLYYICSVVSFIINMLTTFYYNSKIAGTPNNFDPIKRAFSKIEIQNLKIYTLFTSKVFLPLIVIAATVVLFSLTVKLFRVWPSEAVLSSKSSAPAAKETEPKAEQNTPTQTK